MLMAMARLLLLLQAPAALHCCVRFWIVGLPALEVSVYSQAQTCHRDAVATEHPFLTRQPPPYPLHRLLRSVPRVISTCKACVGPESGRLTSPRLSGGWTSQRSRPPLFLLLLLPLATLLLVVTIFLRYLHMHPLESVSVRLLLQLLRLRLSPCSLKTTTLL
jgi:hypothetical protein